MHHNQSDRQSALQCEQLEDRLTPNATSYVTSLYLNLLNRAPDAAGLAFYVGEINNGLNNQAVATQIWDSPEHRGDEVDFFYQTFLHRSADAGGRAFWVNELLSGQMNEQGVELGFLFSPEFVATHSTPAAYITTVYIDVLGRLPSAAELVTWEDNLAVFGGKAVSASILTSTESYEDIITQDYVQFLGRTPDLNGLAFWLTKLQSNQGTVESVAEGILGSAEYAADH
jgi:hypothetical protein